MVSDAFLRLGATTVHELVAETNEPSRRMVEAAGLRHEPGLKCGAVTPAGATRFTR